MSYSRTQTIDSNPGGDSGKQAILDLDTDLTNIFANLNTHEALTATHGATGAVVGTTNSQTLTNKTLTSPTLTTPSLGVATATSLNKLTLTQPASGATLTIVDGGSLITAGAYAITLTASNTTNVTLPTSGTLVSTTTALAGASQSVSSSSNVLTVNWATAATAYCTLTENITSIVFQNPVEGQVYRLVLIQHASSAKTVTGYPTTKWQGATGPTMTTTVSRADIMTFLYANSIYYGSASQNFG